MTSGTPQGQEIRNLRQMTLHGHGWCEDGIELDFLIQVQGLLDKGNPFFVVVVLGRDGSFHFVRVDTALEVCILCVDVVFRFGS